MARGKKTADLLSQEEKLEQALVPEDQQPYKVPENWCWTTLQSLCTIPITDGTHKTPTYCEKEEGIPFISAKDVTSQKINWENIKYITKELHEELYYRLSPQRDDILLAKNGTTGIAALVDTDQVFDIYVTIAVLRPNLDIVFPRYLFNVINSPVCKTQFNGHLTGIGVPNLHLRDIKGINFPLPPLPEQQRIVDRIESIFAKLDEAKEKAQAVVDGYELRKSAILHQAFTGELTKKWREEHGIGMDSWEKKRIGDILTIVKDKYDPTKDDPLDVPYIGLEHIEKGNGIIAVGNSNNVKSVKTVFRKGDVLYGKLRPYLDKHDISKFDGICSTDILVYRAENKETAKWFNYLIGTTSFIGYAMLNSSGINLPRTSEKAVSAFFVMVPQLMEQKKVVSLIDRIFDKEHQAKESAESVIEQIDLMKKSVLARAFRGELGTNDPREESAVELLKQVL